MFDQRRSPNGFLQRFFTVKPGGIYQGKKVGMDIVRSGEAVATVITPGGALNMNKLDQFTAKEFEPPAYGEAVPFNVIDLLARMAGADPFDAATRPYTAQLMAYMVRGYGLINDKIIRGVELQAAQILQNGQLSLTDKNGVVRYTLDFRPKAELYPTATTPWGTAGYDVLADLEALGAAIRANGKVTPNVVILGSRAARDAKDDPKIQAQLNNRRYETGIIAPEIGADSGATRIGRVVAGDYEYELWSYPETYDHEQTGVPTKYVGDDRAIMLSTNTRLDRTSAVVPLPLGPDPRVASIMPGRMTSAARGGNFDVTPNLYCTPNGKEVVGELESRTLLVPAQIDGFGCLRTR